MYCTECGEKNRNDRKFCTNCGAPLKDYTKPRENLLMPEDIEKAQAKVQKKNSLKKKLITISAVIALLAAIACAAVVFFVDKPLKTILIYVSVALFIVFLLMLVIRKFINKNTKQAE